MSAAAAAAAVTRAQYRNNGREEMADRKDLCGSALLHCDIIVDDHS